MGFLSQRCRTNYVPLKINRLRNCISDSVRAQFGDIMFTNPHGHLPWEKVSNSRKYHKEEAKDYHIHAIGDKDVLVGHIQIEISTL